MSVCQQRKASIGASQDSSLALFPAGWGFRLLEDLVGKLPYMKFFPGDWLKDPALQACSDSTRGIWINLISRMWEAERRGVLVLTMTELCRSANTNRRNSNRFLYENGLHNFADISNDNGTFTVISRRMVREEKERQDAAKRKREERERDKCHGDVTEMSQEITKNVTPSLSDSDSDSDSKGSKKEKSKPKKKRTLPQYTDAFLEAKSEYPKRKGNQNYPGAFKSWEKLLASDEITEEGLIRACRNYRLEQESIDKAGTEYVMMMSTFFGQDHQYITYMEEDFEVKEDKQLDPDEKREYIEQFREGERNGTLRMDKERRQIIVIATGEHWLGPRGNNS